MIQTARLTSKGQITIPREVRRALGLQAGDGVTFEANQDGFQMRRQRRAEVIEKYRGIGNAGIPTGRAGVLRWTRQLRGRC